VHLHDVTSVVVLVVDSVHVRLEMLQPNIRAFLGGTVSSWNAEDRLWTGAVGPGRPPCFPKPRPRPRISASG